MDEKPTAESGAVARHEPLPFGAECLDAGVRFRLWAPNAATVAVVLTSEESCVTLPMERRDQGWFERVTDKAGPGSRYRYRIDGGLLVPDPAARFQPEDVHGQSEVIDPRAFRWQDAQWRGRPWEEVVIYELHVGTFSPEGTYAGAARRLPALRDLGITAIELMPLADFPGRANWGYDGVLVFAPDSSYGRPDDLKALVAAAHALGIMVFLDVVYNHFGPDGNYLSAYAPAFFTARHRTPWGDAINFDGPGSPEVRAFFIANVRYWLNEYHFDGLRLDAVHAIVDDSPTHILAALAASAAELRVGGREIHLILENENNTAAYLAQDGSPAYTAQWNDDIHHVLHGLLTGETEGYYADYADRPLALLGRCLTEGFAYQGDFSVYRGNARGTPATDLPLTAFVNFLQNHDQIGNRALGERIGVLADPAAVRAATAILLIAPSPPLLFMGQEFGCTQPFLFFCDFADELGRAVTAGRRQEFARFAQFADAKAQALIPDPNDRATWRRSQIDWTTADSAPGRAWMALHRELLTLRAQIIVPCLKAGRIGRRTYEVWGDRGLQVSWELGCGSTLRLLANLGDRKQIHAQAHRGGHTFYGSPGALADPQTFGPWEVRWELVAARAKDLPQ